MIQISNEEARNFLVSYQNLNGPAAAGHEAVMEYMRKVRCIQFDPLNVVGRNPDQVLQDRVKDYRPEILEDLLYRDRELIDAADKMLSIIPREDYPKMARIRRAMTEELPRLGVACRVIPRLETGGKAVSASMVRQAVHDGDMESVRPWLPQSTWAYLTGPDGEKAVAAIRRSDDVIHH